jgi:hypothetical protein
MVKAGLPRDKALRMEITLPLSGIIARAALCAAVVRNGRDSGA